MQCKAVPPGTPPNTQRVVLAHSLREETFGKPYVNIKAYCPSLLVNCMPQSMYIHVYTILVIHLYILLYMSLKHAIVCDICSHDIRMSLCVRPLLFIPPPIACRYSARHTSLILNIKDKFSRRYIIYIAPALRFGLQAVHSTKWNRRYRTY